MAYITQADLVEQISDSQLIQLTDDAKLGTVDTDTVARAITAAEAEVNGYLATRYTVPVAAPVPDLIKKWALDIAVYNLYRRRQRMPGDVRTAYEDTIKALTQVAKGTITLGVDPAPAESSDAKEGEVFGPDRVFDRDKLGSF